MMFHYLCCLQMKGMPAKFCLLPSSLPYRITLRCLFMDSKRTREEFIKFFADNYSHKFVKSSPVVPFCDPSVPFVNAGMNQFKGIFLGQNRVHYKRVVNSQKCIRVGGKHNDLESVGCDGHHHTFFEMLGNWSFGDYFKEKACKMAWDLLTGPYRLDPERLYVTYFGGDEEMGIEPDMETKSIWQNIGVSPEHILAYGSQENFWEMGLTGPCGPCTEIHYDHELNRRNAAERVNQGFDDVVEIWNLVFIQYNRGTDGSLKKLPCYHVDTGMGLERIAAILQGKRSNYETDLFIPLFKAIQKVSGAPLYTGGCGNIDTCYRILADHSRMITIALADGMFPDQNFKLRRVLRKALNISKNAFKCKKGLVAELTNHVADSLAHVYPEVGAKLKQIQLIINHEEEVLKAIQETVLEEWQSLIQNHANLEKLNVEMSPGIVGAFKDLKRVSTSNTKFVPSDLSFKLYDTFGLDVKTVDILCEHFGLQQNISSFNSLLQNTRKQSRKNHQLEGVDNGIYDTLIQCVQEQNLKPTDDSFKYSYYKEKNYVFPPLESVVKAILCENQYYSQAISGCSCDVILNRTNLYHEAGGQSGDNGYLILNNGEKLFIKKVTNIQGYLLHNIEIPDDCILSVGDCVTLEVVHEKRLGCMCNHTATHIVNASLHKILTVTCQKSSQVSDSSLTFEFAVYGEKFDIEEVKNIEEIVQNVVTSAVPVIRETVDAQKLQEMYIADKITIVPGEIYPQDDIHVIEIIDKKFTSREACCGTHLFNTADVGDFSITAVKSPSAGTRTLYAVTGCKATDIIAKGIHVLENVSQLKKSVYSLIENDSSSFEEVKSLEQHLQNMKKDLITFGNHDLPYVVRISCIEMLEELNKVLKHCGRTFFRENLEDEMQTILQETKHPFLVHFLKCSSSMDDIPLQKATKLCTHLPVLLIAASKDALKARCCVPKKYISANFNAKLWLEQTISVFKGHGFVPRGQNSEEVFNMKKKYVKEEMKSILINSAMISAKEFAKKALQK